MTLSRASADKKLARQLFRPGSKEPDQKRLVNGRVIDTRSSANKPSPSIREWRTPVNACA